MSRVKRTVELRPPSCDITKEVHTSLGHVCEYCHGVGYFASNFPLLDDEPSPCPVCGGSGQVDAIITIEWKPSKGK